MLLGGDERYACDEVYYEQNGVKKGQKCDVCGKYVCVNCSEHLFVHTDMKCAECYITECNLITAVKCMYCKSNDLHVYGSHSYLYCNDCKTFSALRNMNK